VRPEPIPFILGAIGLAAFMVASLAAVAWVASIPDGELSSEEKKSNEPSDTGTS